MRSVRLVVLLAATACAKKPEPLDGLSSNDASRSIAPETLECQARVANVRAAGATSIAFGLDDQEKVPQIPEIFQTGEQVPDLRREDYASDVLHGQTEHGPGSMTLSWIPEWRPPNFAKSVLRIARARSYLACDEPLGNQEPGNEVVNRVDDSNGQLLFLAASTGITMGVFSLPKAVSLPAGLSFAWRPNTNDTCRQGDAALVVQADGREHVVRGGDAVDVTVAGTTFTAMVSNAYAPPATGNFCGYLSFILFKKGLFVPPAN